MCIFSGPVKLVSGTKIFTFANEGVQLVVYENTIPKQALNVENDPVAMVLPVPNPSGKADDIRLFSMSEHSGFFDKLDDLFPREVKLTLNLGGTRGPTRSASLLPVQRVGNYNVSVAPTLNDVERLQFDQFHGIEPTVQELLRKHYASGFSFLVCQLHAVGVNNHPIAYSHPYVDVSASGDVGRDHQWKLADSPGLLFVPTRHHHGAEAEERSSSWDHAVYLADCAVNKNEAEADNWRVQSVRDYRQLALEMHSEIPWSTIFGGFPFPVAFATLDRVVIKGRKPNRDLTFFRTKV